MRPDWQQLCHNCYSMFVVSGASFVDLLLNLGVDSCILSRLYVITATLCLLSAGHHSWTCFWTSVLTVAYHYCSMLYWNTNCWFTLWDLIYSQVLPRPSQVWAFSLIILTDKLGLEPDPVIFRHRYHPGSIIFIVIFGQVHISRVRNYVIALRRW